MRRAILAEELFGAALAIGRRARRVGWRVAALVALALLAVLHAGGVRAEASGDEAWRQFRGQVLFSDVLLAPPAEFPTPAARIASLRRMERTVIEGPAGFWRIHCVAFMDPSPTTGALTLRATDVTDPKDRREVRVFEMTAEPGAKELPIDDLVLNDGMGFERGHRYELTLERGGDEPGTATTGKRDVYAKGVVTLR
jgi:hypothetical protein